jgi:hypothetical protein
MWVFDGEEWTQDDGSIGGGTSKPEAKRPRYENVMPELQVVEVEIVPVPVKQTPIPLFPRVK